MGLVGLGRVFGGFGRVASMQIDPPITLLVTAVPAAGHLHRAGRQRCLERRHVRNRSYKPPDSKRRVLYEAKEGYQSYHPQRQRSFDNVREGLCN